MIMPEPPACTHTTHLHPQAGSFANFWDLDVSHRVHVRRQEARTGLSPGRPSACTENNRRKGPQTCPVSLVQLVPKITPTPLGTLGKRKISSSDFIFQGGKPALPSALQTNTVPCAHALVHRRALSVIEFSMA